MSGIRWRWEERDLGFRFRHGVGKRAAEYYQGRRREDFYVVPAGQRKLELERLDALAKGSQALPGFQVVANPWCDYEMDWDWITTEDGLCLNWAGCLDRAEVERREDAGVARAMERVGELVERPEPVPIDLDLVREMHRELMGNIYPFAGEWRVVSLHKGEGPTRWPLPPSGIEPVMAVFARDVLSRTPLLTSDDDAVFTFASELMNELLAIHPFREGNGRAAFILANLILMQNEMLPLDTFDRKADEARYLAACEAGRVHKDYSELAALLDEWEGLALKSWEARHGA